MDRGVIAKVIVTLLDLYVGDALPPPAHTHLDPTPQHTPTQERTHALTRGGARKFFFSQMSEPPEVEFRAAVALIEPLD